MNDFEILLAEPALQEIENLPELVQRAVDDSIYRLTSNPVKFETRLKGVGSENRPLFAMRVAQSRVIYSVDRDLNTVSVVKVASRSHSVVWSSAPQLTDNFGTEMVKIASLESIEVGHPNHAG